jgi:phage antirepressor YoqD-like protein
MERGLFEISETCITVPNSDPFIKKVAKVSGSGQIYFVKKFIARPTLECETEQ